MSTPSQPPTQPPTQPTEPSQPPVAPRRPTSREIHGRTRTDDYEWLREKESPEVLAHLEAENAWTRARTAHLADLRARIFEEIRGRTEAGVLAGLPNPFEAIRYHSLVVYPETVPDCLEVTAWTDDGLIMGLRHKEYPVEGVQFHPESIMTPQGKALLQNFLDQVDRAGS